MTIEARNRNRISLPWILAALIFVLPSSARAQAGGPSDWSRVRHLPPRTEVEVVLESGGEPFHGYFLEGDDSQLTVSDLAWERTRTIVRADVARITALTKPSIGRMAAKGAAAGAITGLLLGAMTVMSYCRTQSCDSQGGLPIVLYPEGLALLGTGFGVLVGEGLHKTWTAIYRAPGITAGPGQAATVSAPARPQLFATNARPHVDTTVSFTSFTLNAAEPSDHYFTNSGAVQVRAGLYLTRVLKTEFEWTRATMMAPLVQLRRWDNFDRQSVTQFYQLRTAGRWQPYIGAGVAFDTETLWQTRNPPASAQSEVTTTDVRGFARAGFKLHFGQGMFLLTEVQLGGGNRFAPLRIGLGADLF